MGSDGIPSNLVEVTASFSLKVNLGNYQSADFFACQKAECPAEDAETKYYQLRAFCRKMVDQAVKEYRAEMGMDHR